MKVVKFDTTIFNALIKCGYRYCYSKTETNELSLDKVSIFLTPVETKPDIRKLPAGYDTYFNLKKEPKQMAAGIDDDTVVYINLDTTLMRDAMAKKILIIDDDTDTLEIMEEILNDEGFEAFTSPVADDYQNLIRQNDIDLIIIDYLLKGVNGGDICQRIKSSPEFGHLPVIIYSAYPKVLQSLGSYSCDAFIPKPFELTDIINQVNKLLHCSSNQVSMLK